MRVDRKRAASTLRKIAELLEVQGENPFRVRAFSNAARAVERLEGDLEDTVRSGEIRKLRGIGKGTAGVLEELVEGAEPAILADLVERTPPGVAELLEVRGLGPKRVRALWQELGVTGPGELQYACLENRLVKLPGFGPAIQGKLLEATAFLLEARGRWLVDAAWSRAEEVLRTLEGAPSCRTVQIAGELRRGCETLARIDVVASTSDAERLVAELAGALELKREESSRWWRVEGRDGPPVRLLLVEPSSWGAELLFATGSEGHLRELADRASSGGLKLDQRGLHSGNQCVAGADEEEIYRRLGCSWIPPELREGEDEIERAARGGLPRLVRLEDLRGALHNHTRDSDGTASVEEMAAAAVERGWAFLGLADHSPAAHYANGLDGPRLRAQWARIDAWNAAHPELRLLKGLEADILSDGGLDIPEGTEDGLDYVVASVHGGFRLPEEAQTERILAAVRNPACRVLGHPTGRLLLARPAYAVDMERILAECAERGVAVEINANPHRLDLDWRMTRRALELGVRIAINPDAHAVDGLDDVRWGVMVARKAGARPEDIVTTWEDAGFGKA